MRNVLALFLLAVIAVTIPEAQETVVNLDAGAVLPLGPVDSDGNSIFNTGAGARFSGDFPLSGGPFHLRALAGFETLGLNTVNEDSLSLIDLGGGIGLRYGIGARFGVNVFLNAGYGLGFYSGNTGSVPFVSADIAGSYRLSAGWDLRLGAGYRYNIDLHNGLTVFLGTSYRPGGRRSEVEYREIRIDPVFPVLQTYYNENPLGGLLLVNNGETLSDVSVTFYARQYMDQPKECLTVSSWPRGGELEVPLLGLFTDDILDVTEGTETAVEIRVDGDVLGRRFESGQTGTLYVHNRNAITWDDDRKAAGFVTPRDPIVLRLSRHVAGLARGRGSPAVNIRFRQAIGVFEAMSLHGMNYVVDPDSSYIELSKAADAVDYVQFPNQSLRLIGGSNSCHELPLLITQVNFKTKQLG